MAIQGFGNVGKTRTACPGYTWNKTYCGWREYGAIYNSGGIDMKALMEHFKKGKGCRVQGSGTDSKCAAFETEAFMMVPAAIEGVITEKTQGNQGKSRLELANGLQHRRQMIFCIETVCLFFRTSFLMQEA